MPKPEDLTPLLPAMTEWGQNLHRHPEIGFEEHRTAAIVAGLLRSWGIAVTEGIATTGLGGTLPGRFGNRAIGLRADMDALAMEEATGLPHASATQGRMHACGHDGHTAMQLGGARVMVEEGLSDRFPVDAIYGVHNLPGLLLGTIAVPKGAALASSDTWQVTFRGAGTHGAKPHLGSDATLAAAHFITALQMIVAREVDPRATGVVSVGHIAAGDPAAPNGIPATVFLKGMARALHAEMRDHIARRIGEIAQASATLHRVLAEPRCTRRLAPTVNQAAPAAARLRAATGTAIAVQDDHSPITAGEDFSEFLARIPGAYAWLGTGAPAHPEGVHHNSHFDFNDAALIHGAAFWCSLVENELP